MKIGIMTFWWFEDNYGQLLQCYALQKYLRDLGHEAYLIRYRPDNDILKDSLFKKFYKAFNLKKLYHYCIYRMNTSKIKKERQNNDRKFDSFRQKYIVQSQIYYSSLKELQDNPPEADVYIVGSDQVWSFARFKQMKNLVHAYFLDFGADKSKRISYAASWGRKVISDEEVSEITPLLKKFDYISVREESGVELCKKCGREDAECVCDPTLLLTAETYRTLYNENIIRKRTKRYMLLYMLSNECDFDVERVYDFASKKNLEVVYVTGNNLYDNRSKFFATIPEWLYLVDNAEYVITNSFHCGIFATIFHKQFGIIALSGKFSGKNARLDSLFKLCGTGNRYITDDDFSVLDVEYQVLNLKTDNKWVKKLFG